MMGNALGNSSSENTVVIPEVTTCPDAEIQSAYEFASYYALTSMGTCKSANMDGTLLRKHAAKMVVNFAIHALGKTVDTTRKCTFNDMGNEDAEMNWYATTACQLGIM